MEVKELHRSEKSVVTLVIDPDTGIRYVRKQLQGSHPVYARLQTGPVKIYAQNCLQAPAE